MCRLLLHVPVDPRLPRSARPLAEGVHRIAVCDRHRAACRHVHIPLRHHQFLPSLSRLDPHRPLDQRRRQLSRDARSELGDKSLAVDPPPGNFVWPLRRRPLHAGPPMAQRVVPSQTGPRNGDHLQRQVFQRLYSRLPETSLTLFFSFEYAYRYRRRWPDFPILHLITAPRQPRLCKHVPSLGRRHFGGLCHRRLLDQAARPAAKTARTEEPVVHQKRLPLLEKSGCRRHGTSWSTRAL